MVEIYLSCQDFSNDEKRRGRSSMPRFPDRHFTAHTKHVVLCLYTEVSWFRVQVFAPGSLCTLKVGESLVVKLSLCLYRPWCCSDIQNEYLGPGAQCSLLHSARFQPDVVGNPVRFLKLCEDHIGLFLRSHFSGLMLYS